MVVDLEIVSLQDIIIVRSNNIYHKLQKIILSIYWSIENFKTINLSLYKKKWFEQLVCMFRMHKRLWLMLLCGILVFNALWRMFASF